MHPAYGDPGYRRRYGARIDYYTPYAYAGVGQLPATGYPFGPGHFPQPQGPCPGPIAVGQGYGAPMTTFGTAVTYNGLFDRDNDRDKERKPFWNTVGDTALIGVLGIGGLMLAPILLPAALVAAAPVAVLAGGAVAGGALGAGLAGRRKKAAIAAEASGQKITLARARKLGWKEIATSSAAGAGNIGTAASTAPVDALTMVPGTTTDPAALAAYEAAQPSQLGLYAVIGVLGVAILGVVGWAFTRGSGRRVT